MLTPDHFRVNEAWVVVRVNESFLFVKDDPYDMYVLMDAYSSYVFGHVLLRVTDEAPDEKDVEALFERAWGAKKEWAEKLIMTEEYIVQDVFRKEAEKNNLAVSVIPLSELDPIVGPLKELFESSFMKTPGNI